MEQSTILRTHHLATSSVYWVKQLLLVVATVSFLACQARIRNPQTCVYRLSGELPSAQQCVEQYGLPLDEVGALCIMAATYPENQLTQCNVQFFESTNEVQTLGVLYEDCLAGRGGGRLLRLSRTTGEILAEGTFASDIDCSLTTNISSDD